MQQCDVVLMIQPGPKVDQCNEPADAGSCTAPILLLVHIGICYRKKAVIKKLHKVVPTHSNTFCSKTAERWATAISYLS